MVWLPHHKDRKDCAVSWSGGTGACRGRRPVPRQCDVLRHRGRTLLRVCAGLRDGEWDVHRSALPHNHIGMPVQRRQPLCSSPSGRGYEFFILNCLGVLRLEQAFTKLQGSQAFCPGTWAQIGIRQVFPREKQRKNKQSEPGIRPLGVSQGILNRSWEPKSPKSKFSFWLFAPKNHVHF